MGVWHREHNSLRKDVRIPTREPAVGEPEGGGFSQADAVELDDEWRCVLPGP